MSKFFLIFVLAKVLTPSQVALYGLLAATVAYALMALGLDFYTYATRDLLASERTLWARILRDQGVLYIIAYALLFPLVLLLFHSGTLPWTLAIWFFPILAVEHIAQELNRLLIAISEPLWASVVLFVRSGIWSMLVAACIWLFPETRSLNTVFGAWLLGATVACWLALRPLRHLERSSLVKPIDWHWIRRGIKIAIPFLVATLCLRALSTIDRYLIAHFNGNDALAAYVLFAGIANAVISFLDASVFSFQYPKLLGAANTKNVHLFQRELTRFWINTVSLTLTLSLLAFVVAQPLIHWLDRPAYSNNSALLGWTLFATTIMSISMVPHYALYAYHLDRPIILSHLASLPVFAVSVWMLRAPLGVAAVPAAIVASFTFILIFKLTSFLKANPYRDGAPTS